MSYAEILIRPDLGSRPYRLRCRFRIGTFPSERALEKAKYAAAERFVRDMAKQGWAYLDKHGFKMTGPYPATELGPTLKRSQQSKWHLPSKEIMAAVMAGYRFRQPNNGSYISTVPLISETDRWEFELAAVFVHKTILTELPDTHEQKEAQPTL